MGGAVTGVEPQQGQRTDLKSVEKEEPEWKSGGKMRLLLLPLPPTHTQEGWGGVRGWLSLSGGGHFEI